MRVYQIPVGQMQNFSYVVSDEDTAECVVIDPSWNLEKIEHVTKQNNLHIKYIINTHHHFDHTTGNAELAGSSGARIIQHEASELKHDVAVKDGDIIRFGNSELRVVHTPGHSKDGICLVGGGNIFTGDTIFIGNCGRVDLEGGDAAELHRSIRLLCGLDDKLTVYCGHDYGSMAVSSLGEQKKTNFAMRASEQEFIGMMDR